MSDVATHPIDSLTDRERDCLRLVRRDRSTDEIAAMLGIGSETVQTHIKNARRKLGGVDRFTAARLLRESEEHPQSLGRVELGIGDGEPPEANDVAIEAQVQEARAVYELPSFPLPAFERITAEGRRHDLTILKRLALILAIAAMIAITIVAAPPMAQSFQDLANLIDPPHR